MADAVGVPAALPFANRANALADAVRPLFPPAFVAAVAGWAVLGLLFLRSGTRNSVRFDFWLLASGMLGSILVHTACIGYMTATTFFATRYDYLAASHQLVLLFTATVAALCLPSTGKTKETE